MTLKNSNLLCRLVILVTITISCGQDSERITTVQTFADNVLDMGLDRWSGKNTPLLADGINLETNEPLEWVYDGRVGVRGEAGEPNQWIMHNLASQQNLFRIFVALSNLTGDKKYRQAAEDAIRYHFDELKSDCGLLRWGGHQIIDLRTLKPIGHSWRDSHTHELKNTFPFYELMWDVDKHATTDYIRAFWNAHVRDWSKLEFNRHGSFGQRMGKLWDNEFENPEPFFESNVLTFMNTGSDLIYSGAKLHILNAEKEALR